MGRWVRPFVRFVFRLVAATAVVAGLVALWHATRDPMDALPKARQAPVQVDVINEPRAGRVLQRVSLTEPALGEIGLALSLPERLPNRPMPVLVVLGGLGTGEENIRHIPDPGPNVVLGYDWPVSGRLPDGAALVASLPALYARILASPGQVAAALHWVAEQPWADADRITLMGFSLGTLAVPAIQRIAAEDGLRVGWTVLAYGGAPIGALLAAHPKVPANWMRPALAGLGDFLFRPVEPLAHLPHLTGRFLLMAGREDRLIPAAAAERMIAAVPEPKTVVLFDGDHMGVGPGQMALLQEIIAASRAWLIAEGAVTEPERL